MSEEKFAVASKDSETGEVNLDTYESEEKAQRMAETFKSDMPDRKFYLGVRLEDLKEGDN
jgi:hypothetical protein